MPNPPTHPARAERFTISVPDADLDDLRHRLRQTRWPGDLANETWHYGTSEAYLRTLVEEWSDFDWRAVEKKMNELDHYRVELKGQPIHYVHANKGAGLPLLLVGGWPWTFWDFEEVIKRLSDHEVIVAELPGYGFSSPLTVPKLGYVATADLFHELMTQVVGHDRYGVYGADWGSLVVEQIAHKYPSSVAGLHTSMPFPLDFAPIPEQLWSADEAEFAALTAAWWEHGTAYFKEHATKPQTVAFLSDSPAAMASWIVEKLHGWTDHNGDFEKAYPRDRMLATLSVYWVTNTLGSSARFYAESLQNPWSPSHDGTRVIKVPTGVAAFPKEVAQVPRAWLEKYMNLQRYTRMDRGGHFPAVENPQGLATELSEFFSEV